MGVNLICRSICIRSVLGSYWTYLMWLMMRLEAGMKKSSTRSKRRPTGCVWTVWWETLPLAWLITWWIPMEEEVGVKHEPDEYIQCCWILPTCSWSYNTNTHVLIIFSWSFISQKQCTINKSLSMLLSFLSSLQCCDLGCSSSSLIAEMLWPRSGRWCVPLSPCLNNTGACVAACRRVRVCRLGLLWLCHKAQSKLPQTKVCFMDVCAGTTSRSVGRVKNTQNDREETKSSFKKVQILQYQ